MAKLLSFKDMYTVEYRPGEDELINYRAYRRKRAIACEETNLVENPQKKIKQKQTFLKNKHKIKRGKELAKRRIKSRKQVMKLTRQLVRREFFKKLTKGIPKSEMSYATRANYERRLNSPPMMKKQEILVKRLFPKVYKAELAKKRKSRDPK